MEAKYKVLHEVLFVRTDVVPTDLPSMEDVERLYTEHVLRVCNQNRSKAARVLKVDRRTLYRHIERWGLAGKPGDAGNLAEVSDEALAAELARRGVTGPPSLSTSSPAESDLGRLALLEPGVCCFTQSLGDAGHDEDCPARERRGQIEKACPRCGVSAFRDVNEPDACLECGHEFEAPLQEDPPRPRPQIVTKGGGWTGV